jgi:hypothetical protein
MLSKDRGDFKELSMSGPFPEITLVRHGETEWSRTGRHTGRSDPPLTAVGEDAARKLGSRLLGLSPAAVWSSPSRRAFCAERTPRCRGPLNPIAPNSSWSNWISSTSTRAAARCPASSATSNTSPICSRQMSHPWPAGKSAVEKRTEGSNRAASDEGDDGPAMSVPFLSESRWPPPQ